MTTLAVVTGGASGLGKCIVEELERQGLTVIVWDKTLGVDVTSRDSIRNFGMPMLPAPAAGVPRQPTPVSVLVNCAGYNVPDYLEEMSEASFDRHIAVNLKAIAVTTMALMKNLRHGTICNIVSNASHMPMTASFAYNVSKAAAHMATLQMARELYQLHGITIFGVSPNKLSNTGMSNSVDRRVREIRGWTEAEARGRQLMSLPTGCETPPYLVAEFVAWLLGRKDRHRWLHGTVLPYGGPA